MDANPKNLRQILKFMNVFVVLSLVLFLSFSIALADEKIVAEYSGYPSDMIKPISYGGDGSIFGSNQYYSVMFDGEGEATVLAKLELQNLGGDPIETLSIEIPGRDVRMIALVQELPGAEKVCEQYECLINDPYGGCREYGGYCKSYVYRPSEYNAYQRLDFDYLRLSQSTVYHISLDEDVEEFDTVTVLLYYKAEGYAEKDFAIFEYDFETIKISSDTDKVRVAVNVLPGFYLADADAHVDYIENDFVMLAKTSASYGDISAETSQSLSDISRRVEWQRGMVKETISLDPYESFHVTGKYSDGWLSLNFASVLAKVVIIGLILILISLWIRKMLKNKKIKNQYYRLHKRIALSSFFAALAICSLWFVMVAVMENISMWLRWDFEMFIIPLIILVFGGLLLLLFFGPAQYFGFKHGFAKGLLTFGLTIAWLMVITLVIILFMVCINAAGHSHSIF